MIKKLTACLGVYEEEIQLFLWTVLLLFTVRTAGIILNNYAETAFLKRYGVEYMPVVNMINAVATVLVMGLVSGLMQQYSGTSLLSRMFWFCGISVAVTRALIPFGVGLVYPILFMLKAQYEVLLALLFWNLANDLFNTQQSKRLFPLVTAGGVVGQILGSFGTPWFARTLQVDNLLLAYLAITSAGAVTVQLMARRFPALLSSGHTHGQGAGAKQKTAMIEELRRVWPLMKASTLVKIMILLTFLPNVVIPIMNYQFNYAVSNQFASERGLIEFFGYFRGVMNVVSLVILLFVGKLYGRWGLPVALMFHPFNYILAFMAFLFRFDALAAMYARMSTQILRTTINIPTMAVVTGLFPESYRAMIRPFLRGTVVRIGLFLGSILILISDHLFHPRYLSLVALPFVVAWVSTPFWLKRRYADILTDLVSGDMSDVKSMETGDLHQLFRDPSMRRKLRDEFARSRSEDCVWYGQLLHDAGDEALDPLVLDKLDGAGPETRIQLLALLRAPEPRTLSVLEGLTRRADDPRLQVAAVATLARLTPATRRGEIDLASLLEAPAPEVRAQAAAALLPTDPDRFRDLIRGWLDQPDADTRKAGVIAAGVTEDPVFVAPLSRLLNTETSADMLVAVLGAVHRIQHSDRNLLVAPFLLHPETEVRQAAVGAFRVTDKEALGRVITLLGDPSEPVRRLAKEQIVHAPFHNGEQLIQGLGTPRRKVREELFSILDTLKIKDIDVVRFVRSQVEGSYQRLVDAQGVDALHACPAREVLAQHLRQQARLRFENTLRVLATQDTTGKMRIVCRGLLSANSRQRANSQEALGDLLDGSLSRILLPLANASPMDHKIAAGKKFFKLQAFAGTGADLIHQLLTRDHWVTRVLALETATLCPVGGIDPERIAAAAADREHEQVRLAARRLQRHLGAKPPDEETPMEGPMAISEKILLLKRIDIFAGLSVSELSAIASITEEIDYNPGAQVIRQGDAGETLYLITRGRVAVEKTLQDGTEIQLDQIGAGDYFGEMALFQNAERAASIVTLEPTRLLFLHKRDFNDMVLEYPQIALAICDALCGRIRKLHEKMKA
ncbi:MAG: Npt1/Npt2 family nucleotide transporter [Deferrisomatales bacterium]|nr:Npt1/Npt2 family nucleotide transporter [Deferrisomatales bacterium]